MESATWRASADWGYKLGYTATELNQLNREDLRQHVTIVEESGEIVSSFYGNRYRLHLQQGDRRRSEEWGRRSTRRPWQEERV